MIRRRATVALLALALDAAFGELPNRYHPVAWLGSGIARGERLAARAGDSTTTRATGGIVLLGVFAGGALLAGRASSRIVGRLPHATGCLLEAILLKQAFAARALIEHAHAVEQPLVAGDLPAARAAVAQMVSRESAELEASLVASAAIESLSENLTDSVVAPLAWYAVAGLPGAFAYRATNTLDAMVGYRSKGWLGTPSARADDLLNFVPARLSAALIVLASGRPHAAWAGVRADHNKTPSPNSGWPMAAMAHGLDLRLEKRGHHVLAASGSSPSANDIARVRRVAIASIALLATPLALLARRRGPAR